MKEYTYIQYSKRHKYHTWFFVSMLKPLRPPETLVHLIVRPEISMISESTQSSTRSKDAHLGPPSLPESFDILLQARHCLLVIPTTSISRLGTSLSAVVESHLHIRAVVSRSRMTVALLSLYLPRDLSSLSESEYSEAGNGIHTSSIWTMHIPAYVRSQKRA